MKSVWLRMLCLVRGNYLVSTDASYGQFVQHEFKARFYSRERAKAFARSLMPKSGERVMVLDGGSLQPLYVYRARRG